jgi:predicted porin
MKALLAWVLAGSPWIAALAQAQSVPTHPQAAASAVTAEQARERERDNIEDPLAQEMEQAVDQPREFEDRPNGLKPYASARVRYRVEDREQVWGDAGSRFGVEALYQFRPGVWLVGRAEAGVHLLDALDQLLSPGGQSGTRQQGQSVFTRLLYAGVESGNTAVTFGKNWSPYYQVAKFTDLFQGAGGSASGTYNARTDGGSTGTGRADTALQGRFLITPPASWLGLRPFQLNLQAQYDEPVPGVPGAAYGAAIGASAIADWWPGYTVGLAYNRAFIGDRDAAALHAAGIDGDAQALLIGARRLSGRWNLAATVNRLLNHETTEQRIYFDGWGAELYAQYQLTSRVFLVGGGNWLRPDRTQTQAGKYAIRYSQLEVRYTFRDFSRMVYASVRLDDGRTTDGQGLPNVFTIGVRWDWP